MATPTEITECIPTSDHEQMVKYPLQDLMASGILWAINRQVLNPRGVHLFMFYDDETDTVSWTLDGPGNTPVNPFSSQDDNEGSNRFESLLRTYGEFKSQLSDVKVTPEMVDFLATNGPLTPGKPFPEELLTLPLRKQIKNRIKQRKANGLPCTTYQF